MVAAMKPVAYLDLDETLIDWTGSYPAAGDGAREFLLRLLETYEVRWLTYWCPDGRMRPDRVAALSEILGVPVETLSGIRGLDWSHSYDKKDGIDWDEVAAGRPFIWIEDAGWAGLNLRLRLESRGLLHRWVRCDLTRDRTSLRRAYKEVFGDDLPGRDMEANPHSQERPALLEPGAERPAV